MGERNGNEQSEETEPCDKISMAVLYCAQTGSVDLKSDEIAQVRLIIDEMLYLLVT